MMDLRIVLPEALAVADIRSAERNLPPIPAGETIEEHEHLLAGCAKSRRKELCLADHHAIKSMEDYLGMSIKLFMIDMVWKTLKDEGFPIVRPDIYGIVCKDVLVLANTAKALAYLKNGVSWGLAELVRSGEVIKLDAAGCEMRNDDGKTLRGSAGYYLHIAHEETCLARTV